MRFTSFLLVAVLATVAFGQDIDLGNLDLCVAQSYKKNGVYKHSFHMDNRIGSWGGSQLLSDDCLVDSDDWHFLEPGAFDASRLDFYPKPPPGGPLPPFTAPDYAELTGTIGFLNAGPTSPKFDLTATLTDFTGSPGDVNVDSEAPKLGAGDGANPLVWDFFTTMELKLVGVAGTTVEGITITGVRKGPRVQYGPDGANDKTNTLGLSTWILLTEVEQPSPPTVDQLKTGVWPATGVCQVKAGALGVNPSYKDRTVDINVDLFCLPGTPGTGGFNDPYDERCTGYPGNAVIV